MITRIFGFTGRTEAAKVAAGLQLEGGTVAVPLDHVADGRDRRRGAVTSRRDSLRARLARWRLRRRQYDELAALSDDLRADVGLGPTTSQLEDQLRFLATPDRFDPYIWKRVR